MPQAPSGCLAPGAGAYCLLVLRILRSPASHAHVRIMKLMNTTYVDIVPIGIKGASQLTYESDHTLIPHQLVKIPYGKRSVFGLALGVTSKPDFATKPIEAAIPLPPLPSHSLQLAQWIADYYAADLPDALRLLIPPRPDISSRAQSPKQLDPTPSITLNPAQKTVVNAILNDDERTYLLHGVTGSGKTAVYIELCRQMLAQDKSSIVLVPEIALATQVIAEFERELGPVIVTHSKMTEAQRRAVWRQVLAAEEPVVIVGPRSSLFLPARDLGLVVIDECHESSYKQEQSPNYHARDVAAKLVSLASGKLVLGSATPSTQDIFLAEQNRLKILELPDPIHANQRNIDIVDLRTQPAILSPQLTNAIKQILRERRQGLLFLNRRGSASQVVCADCGLVVLCPECDIAQVWHGDIGRLRCHWCGRSDKLSAQCTNCHSLHRRFLGVGTKRIEAEITKLFPQARVLRLDRDSFSAKTITETVRQLREGEIDILIGTQMIAKGLDLPQVGLVGVVLADTLLHIPDIYSSERTYQLLHQVIGRAGRRADQPAQVIIQTYSPDHPAIKLASEHRFHDFIQAELAERKLLGYPPYRYVAKLTCKRKTRKGAETSAQRLAAQIKHNHPGITIRGPAPAWREQLGDYWYWHLILTSPKRQNLTAAIKDLGNGWRADIDPIDLL